MVGDVTPLRSAHAIDALAAAGFSVRAIREFIEVYTTWGELYADSLVHRVAIGGSAARHRISERCPVMRPAQFGQVVSCCDPAWPSRLHDLTEGPAIVEIGGWLARRSVCIAGARYPSAGAVQAARRIGAEAAALGVGVVAVPEGVGMHALRSAVESGGHATAVLYGDSPTHMSRGAIGGVVARYFSINLPSAGGAVLHVRHIGGDDLGAPLAYGVAAALGSAVLLIEAGVGRTGTGWTLAGAVDCGRVVRWIQGDEGRGERMTPLSATAVVDCDEAIASLQTI